MSAKVKLNKRGVWYAQVYIGTTSSGHKIRPYKSFPDAANEQEAQKQADKWIATLTNGGTSVRSTLVSDLLEAYIADRSIKDIAPNTARQWHLIARAYIGKYLGGRMAAELSAYDLSQFEGKLLASKEQGGQGLSRGTVRDVHMLLSLAFDRWVEMGICESNPMKSVTKPKADRRESVSIDEWDFATLDTELSRRFSGFPDDNTVSLRQAAAAFAAWLSLHTGMRCGEVCAVRRRDVSLRLKNIHVGGNIVELSAGIPLMRMDTKGRKSRNVSITERELNIIKEITHRQDVFFGSRQSPDTPLVTCDGTYMHPSYISRAFSAIRDECKLPKGCTFHSLRHTHATWLLLSGVDVKTVSERLGHSNEAITLKVYAHVMPGRDGAAAAAFERFADEVKGTESGVQTLCK